jgi:hypothetical protein
MGRRPIAERARSDFPVTAGAILLGALAVFCPAAGFAQGQSGEPHGQNSQAPGQSGQPHGQSGQAPGQSGQSHGQNNKAPGQSGLTHGHGKPPSANLLPIASEAPPGLGAMPLAWIDDANLMEPGAMSVDVMTTRWQGAGIGETDAPVVNLAVGVSSRFQFTATVPHVVGDATTGVVGGLGTTFFSGKYAAYSDDARGLKLAVAPTLEVLGAGVMQVLGPGQARTEFGVPVSLEFDHGGRRFYASAGWFSGGVWFAGAGAGLQVTPRIGASAAFSYAWTTSSFDPTIAATRDRTELSGALSYAILPHVSVFGSVAQTVATLDENGAGTTIAAGLSFYISPPSAAHPQRPR